MPLDFLEFSFQRGVVALAATPVKYVQNMEPLDAAAMLDALPDVPQLAQLRQQLVRQLVAQMQQTAWLKTGDLRDVFAVCNTLLRGDSTTITGSQLGLLVQRLFSAESAAGGPYLTADSASLDANAQIAVFAHLAAKPLPNVEAFIVKKISSAAAQPASASSMNYSLFCLRNIPGQRTTIQRYIAQVWPQPATQTPLQLAITLHILPDEVSAKEALRQLCKQQKDGLWPAESWWRTTVSPQAVTTAVALSALAPHIHQPRSKDQTKRLQRMVAQAARDEVTKHAPKPLRAALPPLVDAVCASGSGAEITLLPYFFAQAHNIVDEQQCVTLGAAMVCAWAAYSVYDDIIDSGQSAQLLPAANTALRTSIELFGTALPQPFIAEIFAVMDAANMWELRHCRFAVQESTLVVEHLPTYGAGTVLADRSLGYMLGALGVITQQHMPGSHYARRVATAFRHYLIARQLQDDLQDWQEDVQNGHISYVVAAILRSLRVKPGAHDLRVLLPRMRRHFRRTVATTICHRIIRQVQLSRQAFSICPNPPSNIYSFLDGFERSARHTLDARAKASGLAATLDASKA